MMSWAEGGDEAMATVVGGESVDVVKTRYRCKSENIYYIIKCQLPDRDRTAL
eukprot:SAG31_NODE_32594_length_350_cov_7.921260_1_plen_52_part_00